MLIKQSSAEIDQVLKRPNINKTIFDVNNKVYDELKNLNKKAYLNKLSNTAIKPRQKYFLVKKARKENNQ